MGIPVLHAGSLLPAMPAEAAAVADDPTLGAYTRRVTELDYDIEWVDLLEMDGVAPYTYSEELPPSLSVPRTSAEAPARRW